jgi:lysozyme family protein
VNYSNAFIKAVNWLMGQRVEGVYSDDPNDPGNWTGGKAGEGELKGTKFGISAKSYPHLDIKALRREDAQKIYWSDYWATIKGDLLPPRVAFVVFDSAVNQGPEVAAKLLQQDLGVDVDGDIGRETIAAARSKEQTEVVIDFLARRAIRYTKTKGWDGNGRGWFRRLFRAAMEA